MALCSGIKADGGRCKAQAIRGAEFCISHHPDYEDTRRRRNLKGGKTGGRGRPHVELVDIKRRLSELADDVLEGRQDKGVAAVASQVLNVYLRAVSVELKVKEQLELREEVEAIKDALQARKGQGRYGA
jgi:hypothetical protein